ncbi:hypothetical protein RHGRI_010814 [Rhododendron griersonianum]|uniref:PAP/OAS1 substrate-binding domain superfamily n=1 Tax=Rhododendron griersonianum TaxID=479676 RepID=A0AAV6KJW4_9ERIC|nr:hypothetical protein RHGRI_010814 [Rhododendron griersonianum]
MGDLRSSIGTAAEERRAPSPPPSNPSPSSIGSERWAIAEEATQEILCRVQPTVESEKRRRKVIDYVQRLIRGCVGCEVFPFGSVPLKTYLPDGDIDLTAFGGASVEEALVNDVVSVLEAEDQNSAAEFIVKDVQLIRAEVKLVKCMVQNIVVDISFNQLGGLCTLCFLEKVDRLIGNDHLFKRSIILIKAWCYYESRILGAHHGLISTYALETLVLYIFHRFRSTLNGPLAVLYRFLDHFSKFDWDNNCVRLTGPIPISPEIVVEKPENGGSDLLFSDDFLRDCADMFSVPSRTVDTNSRLFPQKHLNIVDPLKQNNNLGRSVSKGNFYRIKSAFTYGARKLGLILLLPEDNICGELHKFFSNMLDRHGGGQRPDVQDPVPMSGDNGFVPTLSFSENELSLEEKPISESKYPNSIHLRGECTLDHDGLSLNGGNDIKVSLMEIGRTLSGHQKSSVVSPRLSSETNTLNKTAIMGHRFCGDAEDLSTSKLQGLQISDDAPKALRPSVEESVSQRTIAPHAPHLYFSGAVSGNGKLGHENSYTTELEDSSLIVDAVSSGNHEVLTTVGSNDVAYVSSPVACSAVGFHPGYREKTSVGATGSRQHLKSLSALCGDYDSHLNSLQYGRFCYENSSSGPAFLVPPGSHSQFQPKIPWDAIRHSYQFKRNGFHNANANGAIPRPVFYHPNTMLIPGASFGVEEMPKPRGTGTYIPNANRPPYWKPYAARGRNQGPLSSPRSNGRVGPHIDSTSEQAQLLDQGYGKFGSFGFYESGSPRRQVQNNGNGFHLQPEGFVEFGLVGQVPLVVPLSESSRPVTPPASSLTQDSSQSVPTPGMNQDRVMDKSSYRLKDEEDFPPLSS